MIQYFTNNHSHDIPIEKRTEKDGKLVYQISISLCNADFIFFIGLGINQNIGQQN